MINYLNIKLQKGKARLKRTKDSKVNQSFQIKNIFTSSKIKELFKEKNNISLENMFKHKINKIKTKQKSPTSSNQMTYSTLFLNKQNSNKNMLDISMKKNKMMNKCNNKFNFSLNDSSNILSPRLIDKNNTSLNKEKEFCRVYLKKNPSSQLFVAIKTNLSHKPRLSTSLNKKKKNTSSSIIKNSVRGKSNSKSKEKKKDNITMTCQTLVNKKHINSKSSGIILSGECPVSKISLSNLQFKGKYYKMTKTSCPTQKNSRKNSNKKSHSNQNKKGIVYSNKLLKAYEIKSLMKKYTKNSVTALTKPNSKSKKIMNTSKCANSNQLRRISNISALKAMVSGNLNIAKYSKNAASKNKINSNVWKNNNSTKNTSLSNKSIKKKEENERDYLKAKMENKKKDSLTTVQSKNNSKLTNRMEDKSVVLSINLDNKQKKNLNKKYPATACHSPKRVNDIHSQIDSNLNNILLENLKNDNYLSHTSNKPGFTKINLDQINLEKLNKKKGEPDEINTESISIDKMLIEENIKEPEPNEYINTITSLNSTMKEASYYRMEKEKVSNYIKQCNHFNYIFRFLFKWSISPFKDRILFIWKNDW